MIEQELWLSSVFFGILSKKHRVATRLSMHSEPFFLADFLCLPSTELNSCRGHDWLKALNI